MKYTRLTKEQFEALQEEFRRFLATQSITADEWRQLKSEKPEVAEAELDIFSDLVWEGALSAAKYLENTSRDQIFCFAIKEDHMSLIHLKVNDTSIDLSAAAGRQWLLQHLKKDTVEIQAGTKPFSKDRNLDIFNLINQGAEIVEGQFYEAIKRSINA